jgi:glyoxylate reductase
VFTSNSRDEFLARCASGDFSNVLVVSRIYNPAILFDAALIKALPSRIKFVCHNGAGYDQIDVAACTARGIAVSNTPGAVDAATANVAMMLMLGALRRSWVAEAALREGRWRGGMKLGKDPNGKVLGILGMGGIGSAFAVRANGFGVRLVYHNRRKVSDEDNPTGAEYIEDLHEFLAMSDIVRSIPVFDLGMELRTDRGVLDLGASPSVRLYGAFSRGEGVWGDEEGRGDCQHCERGNHR